MSMTQVAFLNKAKLPTKSEIEETLILLGYDFKFLDGFEILSENDVLNCSINGFETFFEIYFNSVSEVLDSFEWIKPDLTDENLVISFVWGADFSAGACIGLICLALVDNSNALIYYLYDELRYSREMLVADTPEYLKELEKQSKYPKSENNYKSRKKSVSIWDKLKRMFQ